MRRRKKLVFFIRVYSCSFVVYSSSGVEMSLLVTGSIGIDTVETPFGKRDDVIGGSAVYFSYASSFFTSVRLVGVVGDDCPKSFLEIFNGRDIDASGLEVRKGSKTFRWHGSYVKDMNEAE